MKKSLAVLKPLIFLLMSFSLISWKMGALAVVMELSLFVILGSDTSLPSLLQSDSPKLALSLILGATGFQAIVPNFEYSSGNFPDSERPPRYRPRERSPF